MVALFGTWENDGTAFARATRIPLVDRQLFGWRIRVGCTGPVRFKEVMKLPAPGDWAFAPEELPGTTISADSTTTTTIDYAACMRGWIEHRWRVAPNDPPGVYVVTVEIDGHAKQTFRPRFVEPDP